MSRNRAVQVDFLAAGLSADGITLSGGKVYTYAQGTTTAKTCWTDEAKTTPAANPVILDANGRAQLYCDGLYKFRIDNSAGVTKFTYDGLKYRYPGSNVVTKISNYTATTDDDVILVDASSGPVTITLPPAATALAPLTIKKIDTSVNAVTVNPYGAETIDGNATIPLPTQNAQATIYSDSSNWRGGNQVLTASDSLLLGGHPAEYFKPVVSYRGALAYNNNGSLGIQTWASEVYDTDNIHSTSSNTSRLTVPAGVSKVKIAFMLASSQASPYGVTPLKNGVPFAGGGLPCASTSQPAMYTSPMLNVTSGDYFEVSSANSVIANPDGTGCWFTMEIIE